MSFEKSIQISMLLLRFPNQFDRKKNCQLTTCVIFFSKIQNPGQITLPSIDMMAVLKGKSDKDFKEVVPICGNLSYKSQFLKVWAVLRCNLPKKTSSLICAIFSKIQNPGQ